ncbi:helix-turn-helix transcriptional regulator [Paenibacillus guangzhouensis]|uniref:helix-turn-helix transcriptional regulator n=1 Tax=Paenibacillus guangzhouensis TaxID=1473112 RepID=UPI0012671B28|nr:YafY family protein [Paenibacillus guangzhouensis]
MRGDRLLSILLCLQSHGKMTTSELAAKLEVSERTIHRDMEALSTAGIPVYAERGSSGGWALMEGYRTNLTGLHADEMMSLLLARPSEALSELGLHKEYDSALLKLLASLPQTLQDDASFVRERIHIDGAGWNAAGHSAAWLSLVQEAVWEAKQLVIRYASTSSQTEASERTIEPLGLVVKGNIWYVAARTLEGDYRTYRISRIEHANKTEQIFERPVNFNLAAYWDASVQSFKTNLPRYEAVIQAHNAILTRMEFARFATVLDREPLDGKVQWSTARIQFDTLESAASYLLGYGPEAIVVAPQALHDLVVQQAEAIVKAYRNAENNTKG